MKMDANFDEDDRITMNRAARTARSRRRMDNVRRRTVPDEQTILDDTLSHIRPASSISADVIGGEINTEGWLESKQSLLKHASGTTDEESDDENKQIKTENTKNKTTKNNAEIHKDNRYIMKKTAIQGLMTLALMINTYTQIKNLVLTGTRHKFYYIVLLVNVLLLIAQIVVGIFVIVIIRTESKENRKKEEETYVQQLHDVIIFLVTVVIMLNIVLSTFSVFVYDS